MKNIYEIIDNLENGNYIKSGKVTKGEFYKKLVGEIEAYVESMEEEFEIEINGVTFLVTPTDEKESAEFDRNTFEDHDWSGK